MLSRRTPSPSATPAPSATSLPASPSPSPSKRPMLAIAGVASMLVKMRRDDHVVSRPNHLTCASGEPKSHPGVVDGVTSDKRVPIEVADTFVCMGGVNVATLLRATRASLLDQADSIGANALVDEQWNCTICGPTKPRPNGTFKVQIRYNASATRSTKPDPHRPVALDQVKGVPGLMTVVKRNDD